MNLYHRTFAADDAALVCVASKHPGDRRWALAARFGLANVRPWRQLWSEEAVIRRVLG